jgi:(4-(4-[2-(gamma-L-glutamylamino)ethyl]phenoxymethyl)furan-2-yl)methanamine synthase
MDRGRGLRHGLGSANPYITRMSRDAIGLDIGGANIKAATSGAARTGDAISVPFELWRHPERLAEQLTAIRNRWPDLTTVAVTMTGELCDCFPTKRDGVRHILAAVQQVFGDRTLHVWTSAGTLTPPSQFTEDMMLLPAAANWLALAIYVGRLAPSGPAILVDIGSTTTDIIPLMDGQPIPAGRTDWERMRSGELVYTGVRRTPVCALLGPAVAAEWFATTHDVYVLLGMLPPEPQNTSTADGRPMTSEMAHARLARMLGGDFEVTPEPATLELAGQAFGRQRALIGSGIERVVGRLPGPPQSVIFSGAGEFLAEYAWDDFATARDLPPPALYSLADWDGPTCSEAACARALAVLALETALCS